MKGVLGYALVGAVGLSACVGTIGDGDGDGSGKLPPGTEVVEADQIAKSGLRRMTAVEMVATVYDLLDTTSLPLLELLPSDARTPFDNDYNEQVTSQALIDSADFLAERAADELIADIPRRDKIVGCTPTGVDDEACMRSFVETFGRRALRRALSDEEVDEYVLGVGANDGAMDSAAAEDDFYTGVHQVVWSLLQDPEFLYRVEIGAELEHQPGVFKLSNFEVASRLSYFIWGSMPDDQLLDRAEAGDLTTKEQRVEVATRLLDDDRAKARIARFHAMWLGYEIMPHAGEMGADMTGETSALIQRIIFDDNRPWQDLFRFNETFLTPFLATHYGFATAPQNPEGAWVPYPADSGRAGLFGHGSFLSIGAKFDDTSPVQRGLVIRERLFCQDISDPPPGVDVDEPPEAPVEAICKPDRFAVTEVGGCGTCHALINPLGFGLERYDQFGVLRDFEPDNPDTPEDESMCEISGDGNFDGVAFNGPRELGEIALESGLLNECISKQLYRFVTGRTLLDTTDNKIVKVLQENMGQEDFSFQELVVNIVTHDSFGFRSME